MHHFYFLQILMASYYGCKPLKGDIDDYFDNVERLAAGGYGTVYRAKPTRKAQREIGKDLPAEVAVKIIDLRGRDKLDKEKFKAELQLLKKIDNPYAIKYYGCFAPKKGMCRRAQAPEELHIVTSIAPGRDLAEIIMDENVDLNIVQRNNIVRELAIALASFQRAGIIHRDIKLDNIMVDLLPGDQVTVTLIDYGMSCMILTVSDAGIKTLGTCDGHVGTPGYYDTKTNTNDIASLILSDWWSYGVVCVTVYTELMLFDRSGKSHRLPDELHHLIPVAYRDIFVKLTDPDLSQDQRPDPFDILERLGVEAPVVQASV